MLMSSKYFRAQGYAVSSDPEAGMIERDTFTCVHCQQIVFVQPGSGDVTMCWQCEAPVCQRCVKKDKGACKSFLRRLDKAAELEQRRRGYV